MWGEATRWSLLGIVIAIAAGGVYLYYEHTRPCASPVTYSVGSVDPRFNISQAALIEDAAMAAELWNSAAGKTVIVYSAKGTLSINLIYDEREESAKFGAEIAREQAVLDAANNALSLRKAYFEIAQNKYNQEIVAINARGGATRKEAATLAAESAALDTELSGLKSLLASYNVSVATLNAKVEVFNKTAGHSYREGEYVHDSAGSRINIFEFIGTTQLERVLAHELGHAIGLDHNGDPNAIMYAKNESGSLKPTAADLSALKAFCHLK